MPPPPPTPPPKGGTSSDLVESVVAGAAARWMGTYSLSVGRWVYVEGGVRQTEAGAGGFLTDRIPCVQTPPFPGMFGRRGGGGVGCALCRREAPPPLRFEKQRRRGRLEEHRVYPSNGSNRPRPCTMGDAAARVTPRAPKRGVLRTTTALSPPLGLLRSD